MIQNIIFIICCVSFFLLLLGVVACRIPKLKVYFQGRAKVLAFTLWLFCTIFLIRVCILFLSDEYELPCIDKVLVSFTETLKYFVIDVQFDEQIAYIKHIFSEIVYLPEFLSNLCSLYISVLYVIAPVTSVAVLIDIFVSFFPKMHLAFMSICLWKKVIYFSELNEESYALAKSIRMGTKDKLSAQAIEFPKNFFTRPILVFTDFYYDGKKERNSELYASIKTLGAICVNTDIKYLRMRRYRPKDIYLIDKNELTNVQNLAVLCRGEKKSKKLNGKTNIYVFSKEDSYAIVGDMVKKDITELFKGKEEERPKVRMVDSYKNMVVNLLEKLPLFEPLVGVGETQKELNLTIFGSGEIGTEMFLAAFWCGQSLKHTLCINVVSNESREKFESRLNYINPDILETCDRGNGISERSKELLKIYPDNPDGSIADFYCKFRYKQMDLKDKDLYAKLTQKVSDCETEDFTLIDSDYFVVALGSDKDNLSVADKLSRFVSIHNMNREKKKNALIAYVVYNSELCKTLNDDAGKNIKNGVYLHAFGSLDEVYDVDNIFMLNSEKAAEKIQNAYEKHSKKSTFGTERKDQYEYWSNLARVKHLKYKIYSADKIKTSVFLNGNCIVEKNISNETLNEYIEHISKDENADLCNQLAWLEHRRWNAFLRVNGFQCPTDCSLYMKDTSSHKHMGLKLHPCIVECSKNGMKEHLFKGETVDDDCLDKVSQQLCKNYKTILGKDKQCDYKQHDYPQKDF